MTGYGKRSVKRLTAGCAVGLAVLTTNAFAFACTIYKGSMTVTPSVGGAGSATTVGDGFSQMTPCSPPSGQAAVAAGGQVVVSVAHASCGGISYHLGPAAGTATFYINFSNGEWDNNTPHTEPAWKRDPADPINGARTWEVDCMNPVTYPGDPTAPDYDVWNLGTIDITNGIGSKTVNIPLTYPGTLRPLSPDDPTVGESAFCVTDGSGYFGNQVPITIL